MKLFNKKITSRKHSPNDKHYHAVVDVKRGLKASDSLSFMTSDIHTGVLTLELIDGDLPYNVNGCKVSATISCPDSTVLEIPCEMLDDNIVEIHLGIEGTYQEGVYTFDLKIDRGNARIVGIPTITYTVLSSIVEKSVDDDKFPILDKLISQTKDRLDRFDVAMSGMTSDSEVREARDGENLLYDRLKRDLDYSKSIDAKVEQVAESVTELESNVGDIVQSNLTQLDNRITQVDNRVTQVGNRVTQEVNTINSSIADLNLKVDHVAQIDDEVVSPYRTWSSEKIDNELSALELVASNIKMSDDSSVEDAINVNKTNISSLQTKVDSGQNFKLTTDGGAYITTHKDATEDARNLDNKFAGWYDIYNCTGTLPSDLNADDNNVFLEVKRRTNDYCIQYLYDVRTTRSWVRNRNKGVWNTWVSIQNHKLTQDNGSGTNLSTGYDLNVLNNLGTGFYYGQNLKNSPETGWVMIEHIKYGNSSTQKCTVISSERVYIRRSDNGTWSSWREL